MRRKTRREWTRPRRRQSRYGSRRSPRYDVLRRSSERIRPAFPPRTWKGSDLPPSASFRSSLGNVRPLDRLEQPRVHRWIPGDERSSGKRRRISVDVRDDTTSLLNHQHARRDIPWRERELTDRAESATCDVAQVERRRAG